ncbi:MAG: FAD-dependent monooxygenase, partial [Actinomycetota bacterium]|nr:FAD-dependent monooxygenase [Actinomycetota bacterium]
MEERAEAVVSSIDVEVLIVGGGPVGLTARALLERWGVSSMLVDKRSGLSPFPRSRLVNVRTMEIFRQLGLAGQIEARAFRPDHGRIRFSDTLADPDFATQEMVGVGSGVAESPVMGVVSSQDRLEPILMGAARAELRFGVELVGLDEEPDGVSAALVDHARTAPLSQRSSSASQWCGERFTVTAGYVLGTDGASSTVRELLGIGTRGPGPVATFTTVVFDADLDRWCAHRPAGVYFTAQGMFAPLYPEGGWAWFVPTPQGAEGTDWHELVTRALGPADVDVEVLRVQQWTMNAFVAERFRAGRVLLAGDAAHAIPIAGGLGMNVGI